jgi:hypothetical protein
VSIHLQREANAHGWPRLTIEFWTFGCGSVYAGIRFGTPHSDPAAAIGLQLERAYRLEDAIYRRPRLRRLFRAG